MNLGRIAEALAKCGLIVRGGFHPQADDLVPALSAGAAVGTLVVVGNAGPSMWRAFADSPERSLTVDPLNSWTRRVVDVVASDLQAEVVYPFSGPPY